jgi:hypothetical protein
MKLFKKDRTGVEIKNSSQPLFSIPNEKSEIKHTSNPLFSTNEKTEYKSISQPLFEVPKERYIRANFPNLIDDLKGEFTLHFSDNYLLFTLLTQLHSLGDRNDFQVILKSWGEIIAKDIIQKGNFLNDENGFEGVIEYLNQILMMRKFGFLQCRIDEHARSLVIIYHYTPFDIQMLKMFGEDILITFYTVLFQLLFSGLMETTFQIASIEETDTSWNFTLES